MGPDLPLATVGVVLTALVGAIGVLFRNLMATKDAQLADCRADREHDRKDRDYWRDFALSVLEPADKALGLAEHELRRVKRSS